MKLNFIVLLVTYGNWGSKNNLTPMRQSLLINETKFINYLSTNETKFIN